MATTTRKTTKKTTSKRAPSRPKRPTKPKSKAPSKRSTASKAKAKAKPKASPSKPSRPRKSASKAKPKAAPKAAEPSVDVAALQATIEAQEKELTKLREARAKAKRLGRNWRTVETILDGIELDSDDWRSEYHEASREGFRLTCTRFDYGDEGLQLYSDEPPIAGCLLAIPRDTDPGGRGAEHRQKGYLAVHWERSEDGQAYHGTPSYIHADELADIWADD